MDEAESGREKDLLKIIQLVVELKPRISKAFDFEIEEEVKTKISLVWDAWIYRWYIEILC